MSVRVLVVDDESDILELIKEGLESFDDIKSVVTAPSYTKAIIKLKNQNFDYIIADYYLSETETGLDFINEVLKYDKDRRHKSNIILMSARFEPHIIKEAIGMEINNILVKPFTLEKLRSFIPKK